MELCKKSVKRKRTMVSYILFKRKHFIIINLVFINIAVIYLLFWSKISSSWFSNELETERSLKDKVPETYTKAIAQKKIDTENIQTAYSRIINYVVRPQTICKQTLLLGGHIIRGKLDGDKLICLDPGIVPPFNNCIVYSFGISNEWSFDEAIHQKFGCNVYSFDPSMKDEDHLHSEGVHFYRMGIAGFNGKQMVKGKEWKMKTFDTFRRFLDHKNRKIDVFKMDVEGAEFPVLERALEDGSLNDVNHFCMEIHLVFKNQWNRYFKVFKKIEEAGLLHFSTRNNTVIPLAPVPGVPGRVEQSHFEMSWYRPR